MALNPLAVTANEALSADCPQVFDLLSATGKALFFPKGILTQSAEAKTKAHRYNATIGIATEGGQAMNLDCVHQYFNDLTVNAIPMRPSYGDPALRSAWQDKQRQETPSLADHPISLPVVSNALTHGLDLVGELFIDQGDEILIPDQLWGNYRLTFGTGHGGKIASFPSLLRLSTALIPLPLLRPLLPAMVKSWWWCSTSPTTPAVTAPSSPSSKRSLLPSLKPPKQVPSWW